MSGDNHYSNIFEDTRRYQGQVIGDNQGTDFTKENPRNWLVEFSISQIVETLPEQLLIKQDGVSMMIAPSSIKEIFHHSKYAIIKAPKKIADWKNKLVVTKQDMKNGLGVIPTGTIMRVTCSTTILHLESFPCKCCGIAMRVSIKSDMRGKLEVIDFIELKKG
jgi:hypothetical protein